MREGVHPEYTKITATCSCGNVMLINSTLKEDLNLDVCSSCHPFYTGKQKLVDTSGRVEKFEKRFGKKDKVNKTQTKADLKNDIINDSFSICVFAGYEKISFCIVLFL